MALMSLFLHSNGTQSIPYEFPMYHQRNRSPSCSTETTQESDRRIRILLLRNVYKLNSWLWACSSLGAASLWVCLLLIIVQRIGKSLCYRMGQSVAMPHHVIWTKRKHKLLLPGMPAARGE
jgi:hypothetical protein